MAHSFRPRSISCKPVHKEDNMTALVGVNPEMNSSSCSKAEDTKCPGHSGLMTVYLYPCPGPRCPFGGLPHQGEKQCGVTCVSMGGGSAHPFYSCPYTFVNHPCRGGGSFTLARSNQILATKGMLSMVTSPLSSWPLSSFPFWLILLDSPLLSSAKQRKLKDR